MTKPSGIVFAVLLPSGIKAKDSLDFFTHKSARGFHQKRVNKLCVLTISALNNRLPMTRYIIGALNHPNHKFPNY